MKGRDRSARPHRRIVLWRSTRGLLCTLAGACAAALVGAPESDIQVSVEVVRRCAVSTAALPPGVRPALTVSCVTESEAVRQGFTTTTASSIGDQEVAPMVAVGGTAGSGTPTSAAASGPSPASEFSSPPSGEVVSGDGGAPAVLTINF